jgi:FdrA protein
MISMASIKELLKEGPKVINIGVQQFSSDIKAQGAPAVHVDWKPPAVNEELLAKLLKLKGKRS